MIAIVLLLHNTIVSYVLYKIICRICGIIEFPYIMKILINFKQSLAVFYCRFKRIHCLSPLAKVLLLYNIYISTSVALTQHLCIPHFFLYTLLGFLYKYTGFSSGFLSGCLAALMRENNSRTSLSASDSLLMPSLSEWQ